MSRLTATFESEADFVRAAEELKRQGIAILDAFSPYPVEGLQKVLKVPPSPLGWICLALGLSAALAAFGLQIWVSSVDWPLNIGGKPYESFPAFVPVTFEVAVLTASLGTVLALFVTCGLFPGKKAGAAGAADAFVLLLRPADEAQDARALETLAECKARSVDTEVQG